MPVILENSALATGLEKSVLIPIPKKGNAKECSSSCTITLNSHASKTMLKILQASLQQYVNPELPDVQAGFRKGRGSEIKCQHPLDHWKSKRVPGNMFFCFIDYAKAFDCVKHNKLWKVWKWWEYQTNWLTSWEICMQVKKQQLELDMEQQTGFK